MTSVQVTFLGTGAGNCIHRAHTAIVLDWSGGARLLLDAGSGNSALRHGAQANYLAGDFDKVLLSHHHADHMAGLPHIQGQRTMIDPDSPAMEVYSTEEALNGVQRLFRATSITHTVDQDGVHTADGRQAARWQVCEPGKWLDLESNIKASCFAVDHISGAVGWRVESNGLSVVFSGDTRFSENLAEASRGANLLIHEALCTEEDQEGARRRAHSTAADAARAATLAGAERLILTHLDTPFHANPQPLLDEARRYFSGEISVASDLYQVTVGE